MKIKEETPYTCIRCNYSTYKKSSIKNHFSRKNICPSSLNNIELTEDIKNEILRSRIYHIPKEKKERRGAEGTRAKLAEATKKNKELKNKEKELENKENRTIGYFYR